MPKTRELQEKNKDNQSCNNIVRNVRFRNGIQEVSGSIPLISTKRKALKLNGFGAFDFYICYKIKHSFCDVYNVKKYIITGVYYMKIIRNAIRCKKCGEVI